MLHAHQGEWLGQQLVPREWVKAATSPHAYYSEDYHYGYHWWLTGNGNGRSFSAQGAFRQILIVWPEYNATLAIFASSDHPRAGFYPSMYKHFPAAFSNDTNI